MQKAHEDDFTRHGSEQQTEGISMPIQKRAGEESIASSWWTSPVDPRGILFDASDRNVSSLSLILALHSLFFIPVFVLIM